MQEMPDVVPHAHDLRPSPSATPSPLPSRPQDDSGVFQMPYPRDGSAPCVVHRLAHREHHGMHIDEPAQPLAREFPNGYSILHADSRPPTPASPRSASSPSPQRATPSARATPTPTAAPQPRATGCPFHPVFASVEEAERYRRLQAQGAVPRTPQMIHPIHRSRTPHRPSNAQETPAQGDAAHERRLREMLIAQRLYNMQQEYAAQLAAHQLQLTLLADSLPEDIPRAIRTITTTAEFGPLDLSSAAAAATYRNPDGSSHVLDIAIIAHNMIRRQMLEVTLNAATAAAARCGQASPVLTARDIVSPVDGHASHQHTPSPSPALPPPPPPPPPTPISPLPTMFPANPQSAYVGSRPASADTHLPSPQAVQALHESIHHYQHLVLLKQRHQPTLQQQQPSQAQAQAQPLSEQQQQQQQQQHHLLHQLQQLQQHEQLQLQQHHHYALPPHHQLHPHDLINHHQPNHHLQEQMLLHHTRQLVMREHYRQEEMLRDCLQKGLPLGPEQQQHLRRRSQHLQRRQLLQQQLLMQQLQLNEQEPPEGRLHDERNNEFHHQQQQLLLLRHRWAPEPETVPPAPDPSSSTVPRMQPVVAPHYPIEMTLVLPHTPHCCEDVRRTGHCPGPCRREFTFPDVGPNYNIVGQCLVETVDKRHARIHITLEQDVEVILGDLSYDLEGPYGGGELVTEDEAPERRRRYYRRLIDDPEAPPAWRDRTTLHPGLTQFVARRPPHPGTGDEEESADETPQAA